MARGISCWAADAEFRLLCDGGRKRHGNASGIWLAHRRAARSQEKIRIGRHKERAREGIQCSRGTACVWAGLTNAPNSPLFVPATKVTKSLSIGRFLSHEVRIPGSPSALMVGEADTRCHGAVYATQTPWSIDCGVAARRGVVADRARESCGARCRRIVRSEALIERNLLQDGGLSPALGGVGSLVEVEQEEVDGNPSSLVFLAAHEDAPFPGLFAGQIADE